MLLKKNRHLLLNTYLYCIGFAIFVIAVLFKSAAYEKRKPFPVPLAIVVPFFDSQTGRLDEVFVTYGNQNEGWTISKLQDRYIKDTRRKSREHIHREYPHMANFLTDFEVEVLNKVCDTFIRTLAVLERDLERKRWDKCLYLDGHMTLFLKGFYYLFTAARRSKGALPASTRLPKSLPNDTLKADMRIQTWRSNPDQVIKLRISIKELVFQIQQWQKKELDNPKRDLWDDHSLKFAQSYELFIKLYFNKNLTKRTKKVGKKQ